MFDTYEHIDPYHELNQPPSARGLLEGEITPTSVTAGKEYPWTPELWKAAHAADNDLYTGAATDTKDNIPAWIKLEFDKAYPIHKVVIYHRFYTDWYKPKEYTCFESIDEFRKCVDDANNVDVSVYQGEVKQKSCGTLQLTYGLEQSDQIYTLICNTKGNTVKLSKSTSSFSYITVNEVAVIKQGT